MTRRATRQQIDRVAANSKYRRITNKNEDLKMSNCEKCKFRAKFDKNPRSIMGRIWKWHIGWCPGWKSYLKSLSEVGRKQMREKYS
jgi:hypothetical protein